ncbi:uncharacterized protein [Nothobranchius furzeri]|uniref:uncharacterized protein n=1 Tax=Nothobranchius furzeri TaxID=105023 RepID=UPI00390479AE
MWVQIKQHFFLTEGSDHKASRGEQSACLSAYLLLTKSVHLPLHPEIHAEHLQLHLEVHADHLQLHLEVHAEHLQLHPEVHAEHLLPPRPELHTELQLSSKALAVSSCPEAPAVPTEGFLPSTCRSPQRSIPSTCRSHWANADAPGDPRQNPAIVKSLSHLQRPQPCCPVLRPQLYHVKRLGVFLNVKVSLASQGDVLLASCL